MAGFINSVLNRARDAVESPQEAQERKELIEGAKMLQLAAMVAAVALVAIFAAFPMIWTMIPLILGLVACYDVGMIAHNAQEQLENFTVTVGAALSENYGRQQLIRNTLLARHILPLVI